MGSSRRAEQPEKPSDYAAHIRSWERRVPWYRRISGRTGLQGKLVLSFMFLLTISLGSSCWLFLSDSLPRSRETGPLSSACVIR